MKTNKTTCATVIIAALMMAACEGYLLDQAGLSIYSSYQTMEVDVIAAPAGEYEYTPTFPALDIDSILAENNYADTVEIRQIKLYKAFLEIDDEIGNASFDAFEYFQVMIESDSLDEQIIATLPLVNKGMSKLEFVVEDINLMNYLNENDYRITIKGMLNEDLTEEMIVTFSMQFEIVVGL